MISRCEPLESRRHFAIVQMFEPGVANAPLFDFTLGTIGDTLIFAGAGGGPVRRGIELWRSGGTTATTALVKDIFPGQTGSSLHFYKKCTAGSRIFFVANDGTHGTELWVTDGTSGGTALVKDIRVGAASADIGTMAAVGSNLYFVANDGSGATLWKTDGTASGTTIVRPGFVAHPSSLLHTAVLNQTLFFVAETPETGTELWKTDGTPAGTTIVKDILPGFNSSIPLYLETMNGSVYFTASDEGVALWKTDGTAAGTTRVKYIELGNNKANAYELVAIGNRLYFTGTTAAAGGEPWISDGTSAGTRMIADIRPGPDSSQGDRFKFYNGRTHFVAARNDNGDAALWRTDGTASGTEMVFAPPVNAGISAPVLVELGTKLYFSVFAVGMGHQMFESDGTAAGTAMIPRPTSQWDGGGLVHATSKCIFIGGKLGSTSLSLWRYNVSPEATAVGFGFDPEQKVSVTFSEDVASSITNSDLLLTNQTTGQLVSPSGIGLSYGASSHIADFSFTGVAGGALADGNYRATIAAPSVVDSLGDPLLADVSLSFFVFSGDANRDRSINISDFAILAGRFNLAGTFSQGDFDYDGMVDIGDFAILASKFNTTLPALRESFSIANSADRAILHLAFFRSEPDQRLVYDEAIFAQQVRISGDLERRDPRHSRSWGL